MALTIGVDVGGTKIASGVVDEDGHVLERGVRHSPAGSPEKMALTIAEAVTELAGRHEVEAVGIGAAGFIDETRSVVRFAPNLAWREEPLREKVGELVDLPVVVENDANAMAWGEYRFGAGQGESHVVCVTVGTGIGGGIVLGGRLYRGRWGMGAELGHMQAVPGGRPCGCGNTGCWEKYASGSALLQEAKRNARSDPSSAPHLLRLAGTADAIEARRPRRARRVRIARRLAGPGARRPGVDPRPRVLHHRWRRLRRGRHLHGQGAGRVRRAAHRAGAPPAGRHPGGRARARRRDGRRRRPRPAALSPACSGSPRTTSGRSGTTGPRCCG
jgi:glucokinase